MFLIKLFTHTITPKLMITFSLNLIFVFFFFYEIIYVYFENFVVIYIKYCEDFFKKSIMFC